MKHSNDKTNVSTNKGGNNREAVRTAALAVVNSIMTDTQFAVNFFFVVMRPLMTALADSYNRSYNLELEAADISCMSYNACKDNDWSRLRSFKGNTTPYAWVARITKQVLHQVLIEERLIQDNIRNTPEDYRLSVRGIEDEALRQVIVDIVKNQEQHKALELYYVKKDTEAALIKAFGTAEKAKAVLKSAEKALISQLLNCEEFNCYADIALSLKKPINPNVHFQNWHDRIDDSDVCENQQAFREILCELYCDEDWDKNLLRLVDDIIFKLKWNEVEKTVWKERFYNATPSKELAQQFGVRNTWIDNTYSRLNAKFRIAIRRWWNNQNGDFCIA